MRYIVLPIESLEERYSGQWNRWWKRELQRLGVEYVFLHPKPLVKEIREGQFLDIVGTCYFKARQVEEVCKLINDGVIGRDDDVFVVHDYWFPGIEVLAYIRDLKGLGYKIVGLLHAGTWDDWDFISQKGLGGWARDIERGWLKMADMVVVATQFHKGLLERCFGRELVEDKVVVKPFLYLSEDIIRVEWGEKKRMVVFPHRYAKEKGVWLWFDNVEKWKKKFKGWEFVSTKSVVKNKREYYQLLGGAMLSVSFAYQETWGIAMIESVLSRCVPLVPDRCSYVELYPECFRYRDMGEFEEMLEKYIRILEKGESEHLWREVDVLASKFERDFKKGVELVVEEVKKRWF